MTPRPHNSKKSSSIRPGLADLAGAALDLSVVDEEEAGALVEDAAAVLPALAAVREAVRDVVCPPPAGLLLRDHNNARAEQHNT